jgi:hypothetical protein
VSNVFYSAWLVRSGNLGWATHRAVWGPDLPILATIQLSSFMIQEGQSFAAFRPQNVQAYLETALTPIGALGYPNPNKQTDNHAWLTTNHVTFQLQADGVVATSAFGLLHDRSSAVNRSDLLRRLDFAVYDDDGTVIGSHAEAQLYGGRELDMDEIQERVLTRASSETDRSLQIVPVDLSDFRAGVAYRIDPKTRRPVRQEDQSA